MLEAGARLFNQRGYRQTSLDDIAEALNVSKRTLYYYIDSKEDILFGCMMLALQFVHQAIGSTSDKSVPVMTRIETVIAGYVEWVGTDLGRMSGADPGLFTVGRKAKRAS